MGHSVKLQYAMRCTTRCRIKSNELNYWFHAFTFLSCHNLLVATMSLLYSDKSFNVRDIWGTLFFTIRMKTTTQILFCSILQERFAIVLEAKLLIFRCIKPTSIGSKMSVSPHHFLAVSLTSNIVPYLQSGTSLCVPKSRTSLLIPLVKKLPVYAQ
jgi:hypothetical protein